MAFRPFRKIRLVSNEDLSPKNINGLQDNVSDALSQILGKDTLDNTLLQNIVLQPGLNKVSHTLGRAISGYVVTRSHNGYPMLYDTQDQNPSPNLLLYLNSATAVTVDMLVF